jgi:hypothetical protein
MRVFVMFVWVMLFGATGYTLFHITFQVEMMEGELSRLNQEIIKEQEAVHVLKAEWSYLNRPARVETLSKEWLPMLGRISPAQVMRVEDLPMRQDKDQDDDQPSIGANDLTAGAEALPASLKSSEGEMSQ